MRQSIHPAYTEIKVVCNCGNTFVTRSTLAQEELHVEVCAKCHPFYTGKQKLIDTAGRVEKFKSRYAQPAKAKETEPTEDKEQTDKK